MLSIINRRRPDRHPPEAGNGQTETREAVDQQRPLYRSTLSLKYNHGSKVYYVERSLNVPVEEITYKKN
jgi:hypothetical protein